MAMKCIKVFGKKMCTKFPKVYRRESQLEVFAQVSHPKWPKIKADVERCIQGAVAAGVATIALSGQVQAAFPAFDSFMRACLAAKSKSYLKDLKLGLYTRKTPGQWRPL